MTVTLAPVVTGDEGITRTVQLGTSDSAGTFTATDFSGVVSAVEAHVWRNPDRSDVATLTASFTNESTGTVQIETGTWLRDLTITAERLTHSVEVQVTYTDASVETWTGFALPVQRAGA